MIRLMPPLAGAFRVSQRFGERPDFYVAYGLAGHEGLDYATPVGMQVLACHAGRCDPRWGSVYGNHVRLYGDGLMTLYAHLLRTEVDANCEVVAGDVLGLSGNTGRTTGPHLHLGLKVDGLDNPRFKGWLDPEPWLQKEGDMGHKTTLHWQRIESWSRRAMADWGPGWVKIVNPGAGPDPFPEVPNKLVRIWTDDIDGDYIARGEVGGRAFVRHMLPQWRERPWATCYSLANEPECNANQTDDEHPYGIAELCQYYCGAMREAGANGIRVVIGEWPEGNPHDNNTGDPQVTKWKVQQFLPAVSEAIVGGHYWGRHCYWRPQVEGPLGRYHALGRLERDVAWWIEQGLDIDGLQVLVSEWGIDGGIAGHEGKQGWLSMIGQGLLTFEEYMAQIAEGERRARQLPWLKGLFLFDAGFEPPWAPYNHDEGTVWSIIRTLPPLDEQPEPPPEPGNHEFTAQEAERIRAVFSVIPATMKACDARALIWRKEIYTSGDPYAYCIAYDEAYRRYVALKLESRTWRVVARITLA